MVLIGAQLGVARPEWVQKLKQVPQEVNLKWGDVADGMFSL